jgi:hypothetical protein
VSFGFCRSSSLASTWRFSPTRVCSAAFRFLLPLNHSLHSVTFKIRIGSRSPSLPKSTPGAFPPPGDNSPEVSCLTLCIPSPGHLFGIYVASCVPQALIPPCDRLPGRGSRQSPWPPLLYSGFLSTGTVQCVLLVSQWLQPLSQTFDTDVLCFLVQLPGIPLLFIIHGTPRT